MTDCSSFKDGMCVVASQLAGKRCVPTLSQCEYCTNVATPSQGINRVTLSIAVKNADASARQKMLKENTGILTVHSVETSGPGTELKKLISWFFVPDDSSCKCNDRIAKMNKWGPDGCEERMDTIVRWLKHSAATHNVPFQETVVRMLIKRAISNARKAV